MSDKKINTCDVIVIGAGMGGLSAAAMLSRDGYRVIVLEASHVPGGCSSSYKRKGYIFESGATTLIGFDEHQPLKYLEDSTGIHIPRVELSPSMRVSLGPVTITRYKDRQEWIQECARVFGNETGQRKFWELAYTISDTVWRISEKNRSFPPLKLTDWIRLAIHNNIFDAPVLRYARKSVADMMSEYGVNSPLFSRFIDEQLMITAQSVADDTPFLFGAAGLTYTNYSNYYVPGGLINMILPIQKYIEGKGGKIKTKSKVTDVEESVSGYDVVTEKGSVYRAPLVIGNIPVWNAAKIMKGRLEPWFRRMSSRYDKAWGAFTMGIVTSDTYPVDMPVHHQIHIPVGGSIQGVGARSVFVSMSMRNDTARTRSGTRVLNISCHTETDGWFNLGDEYEEYSRKAEEEIISILKDKLPGFGEAKILLAFSGTPVTWQNWVGREKGRVGGIPQSMDRSLFDWTPSETPFPGLYLCGDTVYPGQGIPGVTLGGINVYYRIKKNHKFKQY